MPEIVRGDEPHARSLRESKQRLVIGIGKTPWLWCGEGDAVRGLADGVQVRVNVAHRKTDGGGVALEHFLVFEQEVVAEHQPPFTATKPLHDLESGTAI